MIGSNDFVRTQQEEPRVSRRPVAIKQVTVTATSIGTAQTIYTVPAKKAFELKNLGINNTTAADVAFSLYAVPPSGSAAASNALLAGAQITANDGDDIAKYIGRFYETGYTLRIFASSANALTIYGFGEEVN